MATRFEGGGSVAAASLGLGAELVGALKSRLGIADLFTMQALVVSHLLDVSSRGVPGDVVLCAPTGSGKTLAFALPIVHALSTRVVPRLRAVVVVPTRDLAVQIKGVFDALVEGLGIAVGIITGAASIVQEARALLRAEILVATPGRLVDHVEHTEGFDLSHVRFLVLDESDRLLQESYYGWANVLIPVLGVRKSTAPGPAGDVVSRRPSSGLLALGIQPTIAARALGRSAETSGEGVRKILVSATQTRNPKRLARLDLRYPMYFEPTQTVRPDGKDGVVDDGDVRDSRDRYSVPESLTEKAWVVRDLQDKPMALLKVLGWTDSGLAESATDDAASLSKAGAKLIFTKSVEAAHRLARLLELFAELQSQDVTILEMSGDLSPARRQFVVDAVRAVVSALDKGEASGSKEPRSVIVVCSDVLARGMDILSVDAVINYDAPVHIQTYLHRVGRTARAGRDGVSVSLLLAKQAFHFKNMVRQADRGGKKLKVNNLNLDAEKKAGRMLAKMSHALVSLKRVLRREGLGLLLPGVSLPRHTLREFCVDSAAFLAMDSDASGSDEEEAEEGCATNFENNRPLKRTRQIAGDDCVGSGALGLSQSDGTILDIDDGGGDAGEDSNEHLGDDDFRDLLRAQVARNFLGLASVS